MKKHCEQPKTAGGDPGWWLLVPQARWYQALGFVKDPSGKQEAAGEGGVGAKRPYSLGSIYPEQAYTGTASLCRKEIPKIHVAVFCLSRKYEEH